jgi:hypothetical protein
MAHADWIIDLGPGAGHDGGRIVFEGTPAELVAGRSTPTGEHLAAYVDGSRSLPICYHNGMSKQIAVRLPEALVEFVDEIVDAGEARSRATVVTRALERERRRVVAAHDAEILVHTGPDPELAGLAEYAAGMHTPLA